MFLNYNQEFSDKVKEFNMDETGFFINPKMSFNMINIDLFDEKQIYVNYEENEFLISDGELRYKDEINSIKKYYKLEDRKQFFRK